MPPKRINQLNEREKRAYWAERKRIQRQRPEVKQRERVLRQARARGENIPHVYRIPPINVVVDEEDTEEDTEDDTEDEIITPPPSPPQTAPRRKKRLVPVFVSNKELRRIVESIEANTNKVIEMIFSNQTKRTYSITTNGKQKLLEAIDKMENDKWRYDNDLRDENNRFVEWTGTPNNYSNLEGLSIESVKVMDYDFDSAQGQREKRRGKFFPYLLNESFAKNEGTQPVVNFLKNCLQVFSLQKDLDENFDDTGRLCFVFAFSLYCEFILNNPLTEEQHNNLCINGLASFTNPTNGLSFADIDKVMEKSGLYGDGFSIILRDCTKRNYHTYFSKALVHSTRKFSSNARTHLICMSFEEVEKLIENNNIDKTKLVHLALFENHYFINSPIPKSCGDIYAPVLNEVAKRFTISPSADHHHPSYNLSDKSILPKKNAHRADILKPIETTYELLIAMKKANLFSTIDYNKIASKIDYKPNLEVIDSKIDLSSLQTPYECKEVSEEKIRAKFVADYETYTLPNAQLVPYMFCYKNIKDKSEVQATVKSGIRCTDSFIEKLIIEYGHNKKDNDKYLSEKQFAYKESLLRQGKNANHIVPSVSQLLRTVIVFFHNSQFDLPFFATACISNGFIFESRLINNRRPVSAIFYHPTHHLKIEVRDSWRILGEAVAKLPAVYGIVSERFNSKELMLHDLVSSNIIEKESGCLSNNVPLSYIKDFCNEYNNREQMFAKKFTTDDFITKLLDYTDTQTNTVRLNDYLEHYCKIDVEIVVEAFRNFDEMIKQVAKDLTNSLLDNNTLNVEDNDEDFGGYVEDDVIEVDNAGNLVEKSKKDKVVLPSQSYSASGVADRLYSLVGKAYEDVEEVSGYLASYLEQFVIGGRCSLPLETGDKQPLFKQQVKTTYEDAVSLYPSAMVSFQGFPKGKAKRIDVDKIKTGQDLLDLIKNKKVDIFYSILELSNDAPNLRKLKLGMYPIYGEKSKGDDENDNSLEASIKWVNDLRGMKYLTFDSISLKDFCEKTRIPAQYFKVVSGVYYNEGFNTNIKKCVEVLFNLRLKAKEDGNKGLSNVIKLLLNSAYGRTIMKKVDTDEKIVHKDNLNNFLKRNLSNVIYFEKFDDNHHAVVLAKSTVEFKSRFHCGALVLSQSRVLMNRFMDVCSMPEVDCDIFYTDTDSMCIPHDKRKLVYETFKKVYGYDLEGENLGQFHSDFELDGAIGNTIYSEKCIILGKKAYVHSLVGNGKNGNEIRGYKMSLKGITKDAINLKCKQDDITPFDLYKKMYDGETISFDNSAGGKVRFIYDKRVRGSVGLSLVKDLGNQVRALNFKK